MTINPFKLFNQFRINVEALNNDRNLLVNYAANKNNVNTIKAVNLIKKTEIDQGAVSGFIRKHRYLGRIFQVILWSWKNESKTQTAIDNLTNVIPEIRNMLDAQKAAKENKNEASTLTSHDD